ncbi:MAG: L-threonylcarbamoyladenylate synthase [Burkholderiaceae bacterium]|jgi:L-threonylcarbamoyladenylate synthase|nr:L-threonylcarbamoyladenylate synthase [Burkholderiaceae bacterium]
MPLLAAANPLAVRAAAEALAAGELLAFPTETVYGLGARADDDAAVQRIYTAKGRPAAHPLIVHAADVRQARRFAAHWPAAAETLANAFWPGPLTLIVPRQPSLAQAAAGGQGSIGLRVPAHPVARSLLAEALRLGVAGVAAPSANRFGRVSATRAAHVVQEFGPELKVLDGGECPGGIESAIVDCTAAVPALLRPGLLQRAQIEAALGAALRGRDDQSPRASGGLASHYAPAARLRLMSAQQLRDALEVLGPQAASLKLAVYSRSRVRAGRGVEHRLMPDHPAAAAHELFAALREFDARGAQLIWVEHPPETPEWEGVRDRLTRAAAE